MSCERQLKWDIYFLKLCQKVAENSKCLSRKIGAIIVRDNAIISTGYNGPARGVKHCNERDLKFYLGLNNNEPDETLGYPSKCPRKELGYKSGKGLHLCQAGHAERNAIVQAARNGTQTLGASLYCSCPIPCKDCMIEIINSGISELVYFKSDKDYDNYSRILLEESGIKYREIDKELVD